MAAELELRNLLEEGKVEAFRAFAQRARPELAGGGKRTRSQWETVMHAARTECPVVSFPKRAYSHRWLTERNLPSNLPDALRPSAERMYPKVMTSVGIACRAESSEFAPAATLIRGAMEQVVLECYADGRTDPAYLKKRMQRARQDETKRLFGSLIIGG